MFRPWNPTKQEIERWLETKKLEFAQKDNRSSRYTHASIYRGMCLLICMRHILLFSIIVTRVDIEVEGYSSN
jgi:hypothetical protein